MPDVSEPCPATLPIVHDETGRKRRMRCTREAGHEDWHDGVTPSGDHAQWTATEFSASGNDLSWGPDEDEWDRDNGRGCEACRSHSWTAEHTCVTP